MNARERIKKTMDFETPDRVPLMCQFSIGHILLQTGISPSEFWYSEKTFSDILIEMKNIYKFDGILISLHGHNHEWTKEVREIKKENDGEMVYWKSGDKTFCPFNDLPYNIPVHKHEKIDIEEIATNTIPEDINYIPVSQELKYEINPQTSFSIFKLIKENAEGIYSIHGELTSPFDYFLDLLGHQQGLIALVDYPEKSKDILLKYTLGLINLAKGMCEQEIDAIKISSPYAGSGFISKPFYKEFVLPFESMIAKEIRDKGKHVYIHTCGRLSDRLNLIADSPFSGIECLDPPPIGDVDLDEAKKIFKNKCFIKGNIDSINILLNKTRDDVFDHAIQKIKTGKEGSGFILSTACSIAPMVKRENVIALYEAVSSCGNY